MHKLNLKLSLRLNTKSRFHYISLETSKCWRPVSMLNWSCITRLFQRWILEAQEFLSHNFGRWSSDRPGQITSCKFTGSVCPAHALQSQPDPETEKLLWLLISWSEYYHAIDIFKTSGTDDSDGGKPKSFFSSLMYSIIKWGGKTKWSQVKHWGKQH